MALRVTATIEHVVCVEQSEGGLFPPLDPTSEPYLWAALFAIDGNQVSIIDPPNFTLHIPSGLLRIEVNRGNHGNLYEADSNFPETGVKNGDVLNVPPATGVFHQFITPLAMAPPCNPLLPQGVDGILGVVAILLDHDNLDEADAERGHAAFNGALAAELTEFIEGRSILAGSPTSSEVDEMSREVEARITAAIAAGFEVDDIIDVLSGLDHTLGTKVWVFNTAEVKARREQFSTELLLESPRNVWRISGSIHAVDECAFTAVNNDRAARLKRPFDLEPVRRIQRQLPDRTAQVIRSSLGEAGPGAVQVLRSHPPVEQRFDRLAQKFLNFLSSDGGAADRPFPRQLVHEAIQLGEEMTSLAPPGERAAIGRWTSLLSLAADRSINELAEVAAENPNLFTGSIKRFEHAG